MAGLVGAIEGDRAALAGAMAHAMVYRPGAAVETWSDAHAALRRVRSGHDNPAPQPVASADGTRRLVLFGECFGYEPRKAELAAQGVRFER
ncbi:MAG: hypothetical protein ACLGIT_10180, partial [Gammaproteobacteria bacterium]